jgi:WD40 repeat protein
MADVFVSYSRRDAEFVRRLVEALEARGKQPWVDVEGIRDAEVFPERLRAAVEESDGFLFVISPDSVASTYCEHEVAYALELNKRVVPLLLRPAAGQLVPEAIRVRNWIPFEEEAEFERGVARVVEALDTDLEWTRTHTRWLVKALEWDGEDRDRSLLLRGSELASAEAWLAGEAGKEPMPTVLQREYVAASRLAASRRQRTLLSVAAGVTALSLGLLVFALVSRSNAIAAGKTAKSQALAAESQTQLAVDPERAVLLAVAAVRERATPQSLFALRAALDASPIRYRLPDAPPQICGQQGFPAPGVAFSPDGRDLAEGLCGGAVVIVDARDRRRIRRLHVGTGSAGGPVAYSPDGRELATCCRNGSVVLVDASTGAAVAVGPLPPSGETVSIAFDPRAPELALGGVGGDILLWNYETRRKRLLFGVGQSAGEYAAVSLAFSPDGRRIAVGLAYASPFSPGLLLLDARTGHVLASTGDGVATEAVVFSPDGREIVASQLLPASGYEGRVALLDARKLRLRRILVAEAEVEPGGVSFSPDGRRVAYGFYDGSAGLVDARTGVRLLAYVGETAAVNQVAFSPDGKLVATGSADGTTRVWTTSTGPRLTMAAGGTIDDLHAFARRLEAIVHRNGAVEVIGWTSRGRPDGAPLTISPVENDAADVLSPDGRLAAVAPNSPEAPIEVRSVSRRRVAATIAPTGQAGGDAPDLSFDGSLAALAFPPTSGNAAGEIGVVHIRSGRRRNLGSSSCSWYAQPFSPDGRLLAAGDFCGRVEVRDVSTGRLVGRPFTIGGELSGIAFDPGGTRIAAASWNGTITIADARTGRTIGQLTGDTSGVTSIAFSPDGRYLATASLDRTARIWDVRTLRPLRVLTQPLPVEGVRFTPGGGELATWDTAGTIRVWDSCLDCEDAKALLALARTRVTRALTAQERRTFGVG